MQSGYNARPSRYLVSQKLMTTQLAALQQWVEQVAQLTRPDTVHWCTGDRAESQQLIAEMESDGTLASLDEAEYPNCYLHLSDPNDVARVEHLTFVCTGNEEDAGPNNNWMDPAEAHAKMDALFDGAMSGRTMYVIPYCMGPIDSPYSRCGVEITDSPYVVVNMKLMTRMGSRALERIEREGKFVKGLHSTGDLDPERRFIVHFPEDSPSRASGPAMAATPCSARNVTRCGSRVTRRATKAGLRSTCS